MRIVIDIHDNLIGRWGSLFIHPLSYNANEVHMFTPGFEYQNAQGINAFNVHISPSPADIQAQRPQEPQIPYQYPGLQSQQQQTPPAYQPPFPPNAQSQPYAQEQPELPTPPAPPSYMPPVKESDKKQPLDYERRVSSQQPTPTDKPPLSITTPENDANDSNAGLSKNELQDTNGEDNEKDGNGSEDKT